jgi:hypothetical protein
VEASTALGIERDLLRDGEGGGGGGSSGIGSGVVDAATVAIDRAMMAGILSPRLPSSSSSLLRPHRHALERRAEVDKVVAHRWGAGACVLARLLSFSGEAAPSFSAVEKKRRSRSSPLLLQLVCVFLQPKLFLSFSFFSFFFRARTNESISITQRQNKAPS